MMRKMLLFVLAGLMMMTFSSKADASLVPDGNGCYYWNGDRNYLAVVGAPNYARFIKLDTCAYGSIDGLNGVRATLATADPDGCSILFNDVVYVMSNGMMKHGMGGDWEKINMGNVRSAVRVIYNAAR